MCAIAAAGWLTAARCCSNGPHHDPGIRTESRIDTVCVRDTVIILRPQVRRISEVRTDTVRLAAASASSDSVSAVLPIERRVYTDSSTYRAVVSGWRPQLDSLELLSQRSIVTVTSPTGSRRRWSVGPSIGLSVTPHGRLAPAVGVSITYSLWSF